MCHKLIKFLKRKQIQKIQKKRVSNLKKRILKSQRHKEKMRK